MPTNKQARVAKKKHRLPYGEGSFYYRESDGRWVGAIMAGWNSKGNRRRITVSDQDEDTAWAKLQKARKEIIVGGIPAEGRGGAASVESWCGQYLEVRKDQLKPKPWASERSAVTRWIVPTLGHRKLADLAPGDMRELGKAVQEKNSATHARYVQRIFLQYLNGAVSDGHKVPDLVLKTKKISPRVSRREAIPLGKALPMLQAAHQRPDHSRWDAAFLQGVRQGEALGLLDEFVDFKRHEFTIWWELQELKQEPDGSYHVPEHIESRQLVDRFWLLEPKSKSSRRTMPMIPAFERSLAEWMERRPESPYGLVWPRENGMPKLEKVDRKEFRRLQDECEAWKERPTEDKPPTYYVPHEARHTTVALLLELEVPREVIEAIVGHSELVENYVHVSDERVRAALNRLGDVLTLPQLSA